MTNYIQSISQKMKSGLAVALIAVVALFTVSASAHAQTYYTATNGTSYNVPAGYQAYNYGTYYNPTTGMYFNPRTGQYSTIVPLGPAQQTSASNVPAGYTTLWSYGVYYNPSNGTYYNPTTGQYSTNAPLGPAATNSNGTYIIPMGYDASMFGTYYSTSTGMYYDPVKGFYSSSAPAGPASTTVSPGGYVVPSGYQASNYGTYYNSSTGLYYDPATGFYSTSAPVGPSVYTGGTVIVNPGIPNTGAGGTAPFTIAMLIVLAILTAGSIGWALTSDVARDN